MPRRTQRFCRNCEIRTLHVQDESPTGCAQHVVLTVITLGLWIPIGMLLFGLTSFGNSLASFRCQQCGATGNSRFGPASKAGSQTVGLPGCLLMIVIGVVALLFFSGQ